MWHCGPRSLKTKREQFQWRTQTLMQFPIYEHGDPVFPVWVVCGFSAGLYFYDWCKVPALISINKARWRCPLRVPCQVYVWIPENLQQDQRDGSWLPAQDAESNPVPTRHQSITFDNLAFPVLRVKPVDFRKAAIPLLQQVYIGYIFATVGRWRWGSKWSVIQLSQKKLVILERLVSGLAKETR